MPLSYDFYKNVYGGNRLTPETFDKYISIGVSIISSYTMDRVTDNNIDSFPQKLSLNIKKCACEIADFKFDCEQINQMAVSHNNNLSNVMSSPNKINYSNIKSVKAGAVSYDIDTTVSNKISNEILSNYIDLSSINKRIKGILNNYLYPQYINDRYYNLMSFVGGNNSVRYNYYSI